MKILLAILFCAFFGFFKAQLNVDSLSHISYTSLHNTYLNDVWAYVDEFGNEYALVGARKGVSIVNVTNPENPVEVFWIDGQESIWRDVNTWGDYAFVTTEAESGLLILNLSALPDASGITSSYYTGPIGNEWQSAHTLYVDSVGYAYIFGANRGNGGAIILDVHTDPMNPQEIGTFDNWYCHDGYVLGDTMYLAHITDGFMSIVDISDRSNPQLLGTKETHNTFTHNVWTTPDGQFAFTTDEISGAYIGAYDISDPNAIVELDLVQSSPGKGIIPHNVQWMNGFLVTSYYSDGVVVFDANRPNNLVKVAQFDTYPTQTPFFDGCWASYPYLPSGIVLAADITEGLFIGRPTYVRASYLEGTVKNAQNNNPIEGVTIQFTTDDYSETSKLDGTYATGLLHNGNIDVSFQKVGFYPFTTSVNLSSGTITNLDVLLEPIPQFPLKVIVKDAHNQIEIIGASIELKSSLTTDLLQTNGLGEADFTLYYQENYNITCGKWGYKTSCFQQEISSGDPALIIYLEKGYYDDFSFDFGWTSAFIGATQGFWERGKPNATFTGSAPGWDDSTDCDVNAYVTGNLANLNADADEVKKGMVMLYSPLFDLSDQQNPYLHFSRWFYNYHGAIPFDDSIKIYVSNGDSSVMVDAIGSVESSFFKWNKKSVYLPDFIGLTNQMQLIVKTSDLDPGINITEAGFDHFFMDSYNHYPTDTIGVIDSIFSIYPNPFNDELILANLNESSLIHMYNTWGSIVYQGMATEGKNVLNTNGLEAGVYYLKLENETYKVIKY